MMEKIAKKMRGEEQGFTLIELMVVVLIIGILIAIALPTFLGARTRAQDKAATSDLRNGIAAAKTSYTDTDDYSGATLANLQGIEPSLNWVAGAATGTQVGFAVGNNGATGTNQVFAEARQSASGRCFYLTDRSGGAVPLGTFRASAMNPANCTPNTALAASDGSW